MARGLWKWIEDRWPVSRVVRASLIEDIPGGASYWYVFGSSALFVFILQAVTGVCQIFFYVPTVDHAYISLSFFRISVPFGWFIHNLHYWGATAMVILVLLHASRVYVFGAYKDPRQLTWILGVVLFLLTLAMVFTGSPLPWNEKGYWAVEVGTGIAGMTPLIGDFLKRLLQGGEIMGQLTLSRFFILHAVILAGLLAAVLLVHLVAFRRGGSSGSWSERRRLRIGTFWPDQVYKDLVAACVVFIVLVGLSTFLPPPFTGLADPSDPMYRPKPEWPFLFLYQTLKLAPGSLEAVVGLGLPLVLVVLLLVWPFLDRRPERNPAKRPAALAVYFIIFAAVIAQSVIGGLSRPGVGRIPAARIASAPASGELGASLYKSLGCSACHSINGVGGQVGPDLAGETARGRPADWIKEQIQDPRSHNPSTAMPAFGQLTPDELDKLASYLLSLSEKGAPAAGAGPALPAGPGRAPASVAAPRISLATDLVGNARHGGRIFDDRCVSCHGPRGRGGVPNPGSADGTVPPLDPIDRKLFARDPKAFVMNIDPFIQQGSRPEGPHPALAMPAFGDTAALTQAQISHLEAYILSLNGVARGEILRPGLRPVVFFVITAATFAGLAIVLAAAGAGLRRRRRRAEQGP